MRKKNYVIRIFRCPECHKTMSAAKRTNKMTGKGHVKTMYCPFYKEVRDYEKTNTFWEGD